MWRLARRLAVEATKQTPPVAVEQAAASSADRLNESVGVPRAAICLPLSHPLCDYLEAGRGD